MIDKSLLTRGGVSVVPTCSLYRMLETVRGYAALELIASGERDDAMEGLVRYSIGEASMAGLGLVGPDQAAWLSRSREDLENHRASLTWLIERRRGVEASQIAGNLMFFWVIRGHATEGLRWCEQILGLPGLTPAAESLVLIAAGVLCYTQGELARARIALTRARAFGHASGDMHIVVQAENMLGHVEHAAGNLTEAGELFARAVERFGALELPWGRGNALAGLAWVALAEEQRDRAERLLGDASVALEGAGPWFLLLTLYLRAVLAVRRNKPDLAITLMRESLVRIRELHDKFAFVYALLPLAAAAVIKGDDAWAARLLGARDAVIERTGAAVADTSADDLKEQAERDVRARLGPDRWAQAYAAGRRASIDTLLNDIDRVLGRVPRP
jgi:hypothetical protein